jgi:hypothetical protein
LDLEQLKTKFRHKHEVDVKDINIAIKAVPFLVKEIIKLEEDIESRDRTITRLKKKIKRQPPSVQKGQKDKFSWVLKADEDSNTLFIQFTGIPNKSGAKICSNAVINLSENLETDFSVISDLRKLETEYITTRMLFYFRKVHYLFLRMKVKYIIRVVSEEQKEIKDFIDIPDVAKEEKMKIFSVTSIEEGKNIIKNMGKHLRK